MALQYYRGYPVQLDIRTERVWESFPNFVDLFEDLNIRTMFEAIAETVGSMMNAAIASGRNPHRFNLSIEICFRFNLLSLHFMNELIEEILEQKSKDKAEYVRRPYSKRPNKIVSSVCSASVHNFRENQSASHLPKEIWKQK
jgi:hypothetical protein